MLRLVIFGVFLACFAVGNSQRAFPFLKGEPSQRSTSNPYSNRELRSSDLENFVNREEGKQRLRDEFTSIQGGQRKPWTEAVRPENINKNRHKTELLAYDETRVKLNNRGRETDYINANYITGTNRVKEYIATQGPMNNTASDFWAMVWQEKVEKIIVLANLVEHGEEKVFKYWPETLGTYGDIIVKKVSESPMPSIEHVVRVFTLIKGLEVRVVRQFHFTGWPDLGVPKDRMSILSLVKQARKYKPLSNSPILVHCSAGIGRTGTVILLDSMLERAKKFGMVNFASRLDSMRIQRPDVVEKPDQYVFAHQAVNDAFSRTAPDYFDNVDTMYQVVVTDTALLVNEPVNTETVSHKLQQFTYEMSVLLEALGGSLK